jgi:hypothetical protein
MLTQNGAPYQQGGPQYQYGGQGGASSGYGQGTPQGTGYYQAIPLNQSTYGYASGGVPNAPSGAGSYGAPGAPFDPTGFSVGNITPGSQVQTSNWKGSSGGLDWLNNVVDPLGITGGVSNINAWGSPNLPSSWLPAAPTGTFGTPWG